MNCKVVFTDTAKADLREVAFYIAEQSKDKKLAIDFVNKLRDKWVMKNKLCKCV